MKAYPLGLRLSVILASGSSGGTIAAVRNLGAAGFDVGVISSQRLCAAAWSRYASRCYSTPPESETRGFLKRLLEIGARHDGQILLATSDQTAWLYAEHAPVLEKHFRLYQPSISIIRRILDKKLFAAAAISAGIGVLPSWSPRSIDELAALAPSLPYPILIKPRTHVYRLRNDKGVVIRSSNQLIEQYRRFIAFERTQVTYNPLIPDATLPILQKFVSVAGQGVHSVTGFIDRTGELFVTRHAIKVLQRSQPVGVGVCFESLAAVPSLSDAARNLCRELGHFGVFEIEFVWSDNRWNVIDFNPRFFSQVGMDIRRGAPLPLLACLDAAGETTVLREAVAKAQSEDEGAKVVFYDRFTLGALLYAQTITSRISREDRAYWRAWTKDNSGHSVDFAADGTDPRPGIIHALSEIHLGLRAFPRFLRSTPRIRTVARRALVKGRP